MLVDYRTLLDRPEAAASVNALPWARQHAGTKATPIPLSR